MTLNSVKPRSAITRVSRSTVCATDLLLCLVMIPAKDCGLSSIRTPILQAFVRAHDSYTGPRHLVSAPDCPLWGAYVTRKTAQIDGTRVARIAPTAYDIEIGRTLADTELTHR